MEVFYKALHFLLIAWPVWLPLLTLNVAFRIWREYIQRAWITKQGHVFLEIRLPKDQPKSPAAMELLLQGIWENANIANMAEAFWEGKLREWFSLEIVSVGGEVRFFIWAFPRWKKIVESRFYAQYPGSEVVEVKDYAQDIQYDLEKYNFSGVNTALVKADAYPINTYIETELDKKKGDEQEEIVDPLTPMLEYLGSLKPGEVAGMQILLRAHAKEDLLYGHLITKKDYRDSVKEEIKKIVEKGSVVKAEKDKPSTLMNITDEQKSAIKSMERNAGKLAFDTMIRLFYMAPTEQFEKTRLMGMIGSMRQFGSNNLNGIKPSFFLPAYPWQDFLGMVKKEKQGQFVDAYKRRAFFGSPYHHLFGKPYVLSTEEVATVFHLPGAVATTPNLRRSPSKKAEAPANLPL